MAEGKITKSDLVQNGAEEVYKDLSDKAIIAIKAIADELKLLDKVQREVGISVSDLTKIQNKQNAKLKELQVEEKKLSIAIKKRNQELKEAKEAVKKETAQVKKNTEEKKKANVANKGLTGTFKKLLKSMVAFIGVRMFIQVIKDTFELTKKLDSLNFAMLAITKSQKASAASMQFLQRITKSYGADIVSTTERYTRFLAAAKQSNVTLKDTNSIFETFTKVSGVLGMNTTDLTGIFLALEQMLSKGKVTTEELRRQLGERLPGAMGIMATSLGVTIPQLDVMLKKGEVLSAEVLPEFARQVELSFGINSVTKVNTLAASWVRLKNKWVEIFAEFSKSNNITRILAKGLDLLTENFADIIKNVFSGLKAFVAYKVIMSLLSIKTALLALNTRLLAAAEVTATAATWSLTASWAAFTTVLKANLLGIIITAIVGVIWAIDHFTISLEENTKAVLKSSKEFIEASHKASDVSDSIDRMADSYDKLSISVKQNNSEQGALTDSLSKNEEEQRKLNKQIKEGRGNTGDLSEQLRLLHNEHIDLTDKTIKFKDEQLELDRVTKELADSFPDAKDALNDYGDAITLSTTKVRELNKEKRLSQLYDAENNLEGLKEKLSELNKVQEKHNASVKFVSELAKGNFAKQGDASERAVKNAKKELSGLEERSDKNKQLIVDIKIQIAANEALQFSYSKAGKEKKKADEDELKRLAALKKAREEEDSAIRNRINLKKEIGELEAKKDLLAKDETKLRLANDKISLKTHKDEMKRIDAEILKRQKLLDAINGKKAKGGRKDKGLFSLKTQIAVNEIKENIEKNKLIIEDDKSTQEQKEIALHNNYMFGRDILKLQKDDRDASVKNDKNATDNKTLIQQDYHAKLLALGKKSGTELDKLRKQSEKDFKVKKDEQVNLFKELVDEEKRLLEIGFNNELSALKKKGLSKKKFQKAEKDLILEYKQKELEAIIRVTEAQIKSLIALKVTGKELDKLKKSLEVLKSIDLSKGFTDPFDGEGLTKLEKYQEALAALADVAQSLGDIMSNGHQKNIIALEKEMDTLEDTYAHRKLLAGDDADQKKALDRELAAEKKKLEKKIAKEKEEQFKKQKIADMAQAAINVALGITRAAPNAFLMALVAATGALQIAAIASTPIPKFAEGGVMGYDGKALINDGGNREFVERNGMVFSSPVENAVVDLQKGDVIHKDVNSLLNASIMTSLANDNKSLDATKLKLIFDNNYTNLESAIRKGFKGARQNINIQQNKIDIPFSLYKNSHTKWD